MTFLVLIARKRKTKMVKIPKGTEIVNKVLSKAHVVGMTFGVFEKLGGLGGAAYHVKQLITHPIAPNWYEVFDDVGTAIGVDVALVIAGVAGLALDIESFNKYFDAAAKYGMGKIAGSIFGSVITRSHNPNGGTAPTSESSVWKQTVISGPTTTAGTQLYVTASTPSALPAR